MPGKNISIIEVAKRAGLSKSTVSRVLNDSYGVSPDAREKVLQAMEELKYRPNIPARALRSNRSDLIGILVPQEVGDRGISHFINSRKISGVVNKVKEIGYDVLIFIEGVLDEDRLNHIIKEKGLKGVLLLDHVNSSVLDGFKRYGIPFVLVNWFCPGYEGQCYVKTDLAAAVTMSLELLVSKGYTGIGIINWEDRVMKEPAIESAFIRFMREKGLDYEESVLNTEMNNWDEVRNFIERDRKRAYISFSYYMSVNILEYCRENNISVPGELALISYEFLEFYDFTKPRLTGIEQQAELMGYLAAEKLVKLINREKGVSSQLVAPKLVIRDSC